MSKIPVIDFISFVTSKVGCYYWYGTFGQRASKALYTAKKAQYPKYYTADDYEKQIANPKQCFDCAGLVKSMLIYPDYKASDDLGATAIYNRCTVKGKLSSAAQLRSGYLVFKGTDNKKSHVGVYYNGRVYEAKGHKYGVVDNPLKLSDWSFWAEYYAVAYEAAPEPAPDPIEDNIYKVTTNGSTLTLRSKPTTKSIALANIPNHTNITAEAIVKGEAIKGNTDWIKTTYKGRTGYVSARWCTKV